MAPKSACATAEVGRAGWRLSSLLVTGAVSDTWVFLFWSLEFMVVGCPNNGSRIR